MKIMHGTPGGAVLHLWLVIALFQGRQNNLREFE